MEDFASIIGLWASAADLARDLGLKEVTVRAWRARDVIPAEYWPELVTAAGKRAEADGKFQIVTLDLLVTLAARERTQKALDASTPPHQARGAA